MRTPGKRQNLLRSGEESQRSSIHETVALDHSLFVGLGEQLSVRAQGQGACML
jgi:hypothetical protein